MLMYVFRIEDSGSSSTPPLSTQPSPPFPNTDAVANAIATPRQLELVEAKVFATSDAAKDRDLKRWVLDTRATNHMMRSRSAFSDLDTSIVGTVRFSDGSVVKINTCKNGEHRTIVNAYFIPRLTMNIISVG